MSASTTQETAPRYIAFQGTRRIAAGVLADIAVAIREHLAGGDPSLVLIFDEETGRQLDIDLGGSIEQVRRRFAGSAQRPVDDDSGSRGRGRPKLGVVGKEVTLLPRHWEWLQSQRGGPSATLRRLVDAARAAHRDLDRVRHAQDAINRFISAVAGDLPGFEEATRALYRGERERFESEIARWPRDVRTQLERWMAPAFTATADP